MPTSNKTLADFINEAQTDIPDEDIDTSEVPELDASFFANAVLTHPGEDLLDDGDLLDRKHTGKVR